MKKIKIISIIVIILMVLSLFLAIFSYSASADSEVVFECDALKAALSELLETDNITISDMEDLDGTLDLSYYNIKSLVGLEYAVNVTDLVLSFNNITDITPILNLNNLESLYLDYNWLQELPDTVTGLSSLEHLDISNNEITEIPSSFIDMPSLRRLYMGDLLLDTAPDLSSVADTLDRLDISDVILDDYSFVSLLTNLELLIMNGCGFTSLPDLSAITGLEYLYFTDNNVTQLPDYLSSLPLIRLDFSGNYVTSMPESYANLTSLEQLVFTDNYFTYLPDAVVSMENLEVLMCGQNLIEDVPDSIYQLENIKRASFASNNLTTLSKFVSFSIPYSYQISFSLNYLDLEEEINAEVLDEYNNSGGTQKSASLAAGIVSADTDSVSFECSLDETELNAIGDNTAYYKALLFKSENGELTLVGQGEAEGEDASSVTVSHEGALAGEADYLIVLVIKDDSWPVVYIKYSGYVTGVEVTEAVTPTPEPTVEAATPTPTAEIAEQNTEETDNSSKILLYILLLGVIIIITAIIIQIVFYRRR